MLEHRSNLSSTPLKCISIILCENLYRIAGPQNFILVNTFHSFRVSKCPCKFPKINVLYSVTDGHGTYEMVLDVVHGSSGKVVMACKDRYTVADPLSVGDVQMILRNIPLPGPGKYWIELKCNGELVGQRPFYVDLMSDPVATQNE